MSDTGSIDPEMFEDITFEYLHYDVEDNVAIITVDRPTALNALNNEVMVELNIAFEMAEADLEVRQDHYRASRAKDIGSSSAPITLDQAGRRQRDAHSIAWGRNSVNAAGEIVVERQTELAVASQAVKGLERLDDRLAEENRLEARRVEVVDADEMVTTRFRRTDARSAR